ncbi:MAG: DUF2975 domain-containing protein [Oscillospiraceae bacterium]|nr:DUF2975 domain-containing protein [Oscillospiraceae bacterium]MBQ8978698.1 DUF2975 domain-containing protein [Oscillospiraceae bacterium]
MESIIERKSAVQGKLKKGSLIISAVCAAASVFNVVMAVIRGRSYLTYAHDTLSRYGLSRVFVGSLISAVVMALAAWLFYRISKDGEPFSIRNMRLVNVIGGLVLANSILSVAVADIISGSYMLVHGAAIDPNAFAVGLLFLCTGHIIRYGAMLQQESDETL